MLYTRGRAGLPGILAMPLLFALLQSGCQSHFHEEHYFASQTMKLDPVTGTQTPVGPKNYFRVTVDGLTELQNSRYVSGYFDPEAVETYFGEFKQPANLTGVVKKQETTTTTVEPLNGEKSGKLVLILSANSDDVAAGIGNIAQSSDLAATIATFAAGPRLQEAGAAAADLETLKSLARAEYDMLEAMMGTDSSVSRDDLNAALLTYVNTMAAKLGVAPFSKLSDAAKWLQTAMPLLLKEVNP